MLHVILGEVEFFRLPPPPSHAPCSQVNICISDSPEVTDFLPGILATTLLPQHPGVYWVYIAPTTLQHVQGFTSCLLHACIDIETRLGRCKDVDP